MACAVGINAYCLARFGTFLGLDAGGGGVSLNLARRSLLEAKKKNGDGLIMSAG